MLDIITNMIPAYTPPIHQTRARSFYKPDFSIEPKHLCRNPLSM